MEPKILNGAEVASYIKEQLKTMIDAFVEVGNRRPRLCVVQVGNNPASSIYVKHKRKDCEEIGIDMDILYFGEDEAPGRVMEAVRDKGADPCIDGIIIQLPLPTHFDESALLNCIPAHKDVDGFRAENVGKLWLDDSDAFIPCTPLGIDSLFYYYDLPTIGKHCVVIGRSNIVGKPMANIMLDSDCTVTICHSKTENLGEIVKTADIVIAAAGQKHLVKPWMIKPGAILIDVGMHRNEDNKLSGDIDPECYPLSSAYTPVPGGVGPMTRAMLLFNTIGAYVNRTDILINEIPDKVLTNLLALPLDKASKPDSIFR